MLCGLYNLMNMSEHIIQFKTIGATILTQSNCSFKFLIFCYCRMYYHYHLIPRGAFVLKDFTKFILKQYLEEFLELIFKWKF